MLIDTIAKYDGKLLHHRFAYQFFREQCLPQGNLIAFRAPMEVLAEGMLDQEDALRQAFIYSDDAINFVWEIPLLGTSAFAAVAYQRLFNTHLGQTLAQPEFLNQAVHMRGDDIYVTKAQDAGKCSVSITHVVDGAALGHTGININAGKRAPQEAYSTQLSNAQVHQLIDTMSTHFSKLNHNLFIATTKIVRRTQ